MTHIPSERAWDRAHDPPVQWWFSSKYDVHIMIGVVSKNYRLYIECMCLCWWTEPGHIVWMKKCTKIMWICSGHEQDKLLFETATHLQYFVSFWGQFVSAQKIQKRHTYMVIIPQTRRPKVSYRALSDVWDSADEMKRCRVVRCPFRWIRPLQRFHETESIPRRLVVWLAIVLSSGGWLG